METWRRIETWDCEPGLAMAIDEALLLYAEGEPVLRFYTWRPAALSLGYFQRRRDVPEARRAACVVRRITGGGAIHHAKELTFSITASLTHPLFAGPVRSSYERVHGWIAAALARHGVAARMRGSAGLGSDRAGSGMCFQKSTDVDLAWNGRKGVGSAQRRRGGRVLHHGSIKLGASELEGDLAWVDVPADTLAQSLARELEVRLACALEPSAMRPRERSHASERASHFSSEAYLAGR
jgi:lipoate-protein ligase A